MRAKNVVDGEKPHNGKKQRPITSRQVLFLLPLDWHERLARLAEADDRTLQFMARRLTMKGIERLEAELGMPPVTAPAQEQQAAA